MKKLLLIALTGLLTLGASAPALALGPLDDEAELPVYSKYVWRGMNLVDDAVLQPSLEVGLFGFELAVWGNLYLTGLGGVWIVSPAGVMLEFVEVPEFASNVTFGGAKGKTLFITCSRKVYSLAMRVRGARTGGHSE